ncbi:MAG: YlxR family protein [Clostridium sp.]|nr:MAG: YlxR family protein [Clostridium sp.]
MQNKKPVLRSCVVSRETLEKKDLFRIVRDKDGNVSVDLKRQG